MELLGQEEIGSFVVRDSTSQPGCYALSVKVPKYDNPTGISHFLIMRHRAGYRLKVKHVLHMMDFCCNLSLEIIFFAFSLFNMPQV